MSSIYDFIINGITQCFNVLSNFDIGGISMLQFALGLMIIPPIVKLLITRVEMSQSETAIGQKARAKEIKKNDNESK